ncbi:hypothetical protein [Pinisolibacter aquiterrae]|uniref:hypothetical protein n=1 Tax=Pinisolibacter aquiterrae TaxID=2815579 RepID=UPI001E472A2C|nr:hypothetical protein [Pinisolibacter aquiterrae]MCC8237227.1 hypothetical protein [Pinisolibacter aquiterrae]
MLPKRGRILPGHAAAARSPTDFANAVARALQSELGDTHRAVKTIMRWTGASERAAKNWLEGSAGPRGHYLIRLIAESNLVFELVIDAADRTVIGEAPSVGGNGILDKKATAGGKPWGASRRSPGSTTSREALRTADGMPNVPGKVPINDPGNDPGNSAWPTLLNDRQRWFLGEMAVRGRLRFTDIVVRWEVAAKTAKRDIAGLQATGLIVFVGPRKTGMYLVRSNPPTE